jgi:cytochrome bd ubiquinol oxidase subunit I
LKRFSRFFLILTNVFGAISGIGIWFIIGLISPQATSSLIRLFGFVWGLEWGIFILEIVTLIFYYYGWEKMDPKLHMKLGWLYAITAFFSLFAINGIITFMLTPGKWTQTHHIWDGYFNPGFWPSLVVRTLICITLAGIYATFVISKMDENSRFRKELLAYTSTWLLPSYVLLAGAFVWYYSVLPQPIMENLLSGLTGAPATGALTLSNVARVALLGIIASMTVGLAFFVSAYLNPREFTVRKSAILLFTAAILVTSFEYSREMLRKPYVIRDFMFSNGVTHEAITKLPLNRSFTENMRFKPINSSVGEQMFIGQCMSCHTMSGYRSLKKRLTGFDSKGIYENVLLVLQKPPAENRYHKIMPPVIGTEEELKALADYLYVSVNEPDKTNSKAAEPMAVMAKDDDS